MSQIPGFIKWGVSILFVIAFITIGYSVFLPSTEAAKLATSELSTINTELKDQKYLIYDNTTVSGSSVINAMRKFKEEGESGNISITVTTGKNPAGTSYYNTFTYTSGIGTKAESPTNINDPTHYKYINPSGNFKADVQRDKNSVIRSITFKQVMN